MKTLLFIFLATTLNISADEAPVCHKCEVIREYNAAHPENNYYWYDDYLKENNLDKNGEKKPSSEFLSECTECNGKKRRERPSREYLSECTDCKGKKRRERPSA